MKKGKVKRKGGKTTIHFIADEANVQMLMKLTL